MSDQFVQEADPEDVFTLLADETRLDILRALWDAGEAQSFSDLYEAVDVDDTGQFNYHLDKLVSQFVASTDDGYRLTQAGKQMHGAIRSGTYTVAGELGPISLPESCRMCGGALSLDYEDEIARVECDSCEAGWTGAAPPAALAGVDREEIPERISQYFRTTLRQIAVGFCTYCNGQTEPTVGPIAELDVGASPDTLSHPVVQFDCQRCGHTSGLSLDHALLLIEPAVEEFYRDHGIDVRDRAVWNVPHLDPNRPTIEETDPIRATVPFQIDDETLTATVDENLDILSLDRQSA